MEINKIQQERIEMLAAKIDKTPDQLLFIILGGYLSTLYLNEKDYLEYRRLLSKAILAELKELNLES